MFIGENGNDFLLTASPYPVTDCTNHRPGSQLIVVIKNYNMSNIAKKFKNVLIVLYSAVYTV